MSAKLLTEHHLRFLSLKEGCTGSPESILVKMLHCLKPHVAAISTSYLESLSVSADHGGAEMCQFLVPAVPTLSFPSGNRVYHSFICHPESPVAVCLCDDDDQ